MLAGRRGWSLDRCDERSMLATVSVAGPGARGPHHGATDITWCIGSTEETQTWTTSFFSVAGIIGWFTKAAGSWSRPTMAGSSRSDQWSTSGQLLPSWRGDAAHGGEAGPD